MEKSCVKNKLCHSTRSRHTGRVLDDVMGSEDGAQWDSSTKSSESRVGPGCARIGNSPPDHGGGRGGVTARTKSRVQREERTPGEAIGNLKWGAEPNEKQRMPCRAAAARPEVQAPHGAGTGGAAEKGAKERKREGKKGKRKGKKGGAGARGKHKRGRKTAGGAGGERQGQ